MHVASASLAPECAHPLLYASFIPMDTTGEVTRIDLHKPQRSYSVGRNPNSDIFFKSRNFDWSVCKVEWDGRDEVRVVDKGSVNGVWVNRKRIAPHGFSVLHHGDIVFFSLCKLEGGWRGRTPPSLRYQSGDNYAYTFHQYTDRLPPLVDADQAARARLDELERTCRRIDEELEKLRQERESVVSERQSILDGFPQPPPNARDERAGELRRTWDK
ncbi:unnamed protein product [Peniophora sp. CBMAI 1063]|nr:unnamed protein product [Peniophora sp. CBMAI 1063]